MGRYDEYKLQVLATSKRLSEQGYFGSRTGTAGNVSMLIESERLIAVTPTRMRYDLMTADDVCVVDFKLRSVEGMHKPSIEAPMHVAAYKVRGDVNAVIHTHQIFASALSLVKEPIPPLFDEITLAIGNIVDIIPYALSGTPELHDMVTHKLANRCHCYILQNHGALCVGADLNHTFTCVELLEKTASTYVHALSTGRPITTLPDDIVRKLHALVLSRQDREIARKNKLVSRQALSS